ncbi:MAG: heme-dependent oxidative N-demethylase subunit alpha family protein, partial [Paracoccaceae bacterium]
ANSLLYVDPSLHQPRQEGESRPRQGLAAEFVRSERQCLRRLPETGAVIFSIHTYVVHRDNLTKAQEVSLQEHLRAGAPHN